MAQTLGLNARSVKMKLYSPVDSPVIIGCTGGSGSRLLQHIVSDAGVFMGKNLNNSRDAMDFEPFLDEVINPILAQTRSVNYHSEMFTAHVERLRTLIENYVMEIPAISLSWGWKCPRNIYILPLIHALYPNMRFIHLVRDGRDMALSGNQNQLRKHYSYYFGKPLSDSLPVYSIELWQGVNIDAAHWAKAILQENYYRLKFEDLCTDPQNSISGLAKFLDGNWNVDTLAKLVQTPDTVGRYLQLENAQRMKLERAGAEGLKYFGYV
jgi:hypothetical protein